MSQIIQRLRQVSYKSQFTKIGFFLIKVIKFFLRGVVWIIWELIPLRFIWEKLHPPRKDDSQQTRPPVTFGVWVIGFYVAIYGVASQRYENKLDRLEVKVSSIYQLAGTPQYKAALGRIATVQATEIPEEPILWPPSLSPVRSLFIQGLPHRESVDALKLIVESFRDKPAIDRMLSGVNLRKADLRGTDLREAKLFRADLRGADLRGADLLWADLSGAKLFGVELFRADLSGADLSLAEGITQSQIDEACGNQETKLPKGITIKNCPEKKD